ncbi:MAG: LytTR family transcriptional regulator [Clostridia bacterium]|nr:LytTR family transcriptional regulator [Clostridia bacterium]
MKCNVNINTNEIERVDVYAHARTPLVEQIETLVNNSELSLVGIKDDETIPIDVSEVQRFFVEGGKVFASLENAKYTIKYRIYQLEELVGDAFCKINQSSLVAVAYIKKFVASWDGSLIVELKNGDRDYVSRRQTKIVMERMKLK